MTLKEKIVAARRRIENPENWTQQALARDKDGEPVRATSRYTSEDALKNAFSWCASGALYVEGAIDPTPTDVFWRLDALPYPESLPGFNDSHTHEEVLALFDRAIALCES